MADPREDGMEAVEEDDQSEEMVSIWTHQNVYTPGGFQVWGLCDESYFNGDPSY